MRIRAISVAGSFRSPSWSDCRHFHADRSSGSLVSLVRENERFLSPFFAASHAGTSLTGLSEMSMSVRAGRSFSVSGTDSNLLLRRYMRRRFASPLRSGSAESLFPFRRSHFSPVSFSTPSTFSSLLRSRFR